MGLLVFFCQVWGVIVIVTCLMSIHPFEQIAFPPPQCQYFRVFFLWLFFATESCFQSELGLGLAFEGGAFFPPRKSPPNFLFQRTPNDFPIFLTFFPRHVKETIPILLGHLFPPELDIYLPPHLISPPMTPTGGYQRSCLRGECANLSIVSRRKSLLCGFADARMRNSNIVC